METTTKEKEKKNSCSRLQQRFKGSVELSGLRPCCREPPPSFRPGSNRCLGLQVGCEDASNSVRRLDGVWAILDSGKRCLLCPAAGLRRMTELSGTFTAQLSKTPVDT